MFAAGRGISTGIIGVKKTKKKPKRTDLTLRERLYLPFMWTTCVTCFLGLILLSGGIAMVVIGYFAKHFSAVILLPQLPSNNTQNHTDVFISDPKLQGILKSLCYFGPPIMAIGAFVIILSCVVVCETRDKVLDLVKDQRQEIMKTRPDFYDLIQREIRRREEDIKRGWFNQYI